MAKLASAKTSKDKSAEQMTNRPRERARQSEVAGPQGRLLDLQRAAGNRAVSQLLQSFNRLPSENTVLQRKCASCTKGGSKCSGCGQKERPRVSKPIQAKLAVSHPADRFEREADQVAEQIMRTPDAAGLYPKRKSEPMIQREEIDETVSETEMDQAEHFNALSSGGHRLAESARAFFEPHFGYDLSGVRVHTDARAARAAQSANAIAYTVGRDIVFGAGKYAPETRQGRHLLAHELTHVAQQGAYAGMRGAVIQRDKEKAKPPAKDATQKKAPAKRDCPKPAASQDQKLTMQPSINGEACACLVVIHNNERNARETAKLMHQHCSYNMLMLDPDDKCRRIVLPKHTADVDPNELFPPDIAEECTNDEKSCRDRVQNKSATANQSKIKKRVQTQFFLEISDCSKSFSLPVVALHNNDVNDTQSYRKKMSKPDDIKDLEQDVDKGSKKTGEDQLKKIEELLKKKLTEAEVEGLAGRKKFEGKDTKTGMTNIFRWCVSDELARCHIGDPQHPDNVVWVTNEEDFKKLSQKKINVALQALPVKGGESEKDLSTLFITLRRVFAEKSDKFIRDLEILMKLNPFEWGNPILKILKILEQEITRDRIKNLHFVNVETPGVGLKAQSDAERIRNYEAIVEVLSAVGLHCCPDPAKNESAIKEGLKFDEKAKPQKTK